jgi:NADH-quinone oxidoreductase subunit G
VPLEVPTATSATEAKLRLGTFRSLWAAKEVDVSPSLKFLRPQQVVELSPQDAQALGIRDGDRAEVGTNGTRVRGAAKLRAAIPGGSVFLAEGTHEEPANALTEALVEVRRA